MARILVFGDSITYGAFDSESGGWVDRLKAFFFRDGRNYKYSVYNVGISGDTTQDLLERFEFETQQRTKEDDNKDDIIIFNIGTNDSGFLASKKDNWINSKKFRKNIKNLIELAKKFSEKIIFVGPIPVDESKTTPIPWAPDVSYTNETIKKYSEIIDSVCKENKVYFIDLSDKFLKLDYKSLSEDGVHPNPKGHQKIFEIVKDFLFKDDIIFS